MLTNTTVSGNSPEGILSEFGSDITLVNSIFWNNQFNEVLLGSSSSASAYYCNIMGGVIGTGNIDEDPLFVEPDSGNFNLSEGSPCIDAGNPDTVYNDIEDPYNPGYALHPSQGTIRNDMGAYGGHGYYYSTIAVDEKPVSIPHSISLSNYPNPFNSITTIEYDLPATGKVRLTVLDLLGREVAVLVDEIRPSGSYIINWDAGNAASGVYFYRLETTRGTIHKKMVLVK